MQILTTKIWNQSYTVRAANWGDASAPVQARMGDGSWGARGQVADYRHSPERALRDFIEEGEDIDAETSEDIDDAIEASIEDYD